MTDIDISQLQRWLAEQFTGVNRRLFALEAAINDLAKIQATSGEVDAVAARLTSIEERLT